MRRLSILLVLLTLLEISMQGKELSLDLEIDTDDDEDNELDGEIDEDELKDQVNKVVSDEGKNLFQMINDEDSALDIAKFLAKNKVTIKKLFIISSWKGIRIRSKLPRVKKYIDDKVKTFYKMNVDVAFELLGNVAKLLRVAYAGCKGYPCSTSVLAVLSKYQDLISDSKSLSSHFVNVVIKALRYHGSAYYHAKKNNFKKSLSYLKRSIPLAEGISENATQIVKEATAVTTMSEQALYDASNDEVGTINEKRKIEMMLRNISAANTRLETETKEIKENTEELEADIREMRGDELTLILQENIEKERNVLLDKCRLVQTSILIKCGGWESCSKRAVKVSTELCNTEVDQTLSDNKNRNLARIARKIENIRKQRLQLIMSRLKVKMNYATVYGKFKESIERLRNARVEKNDLKKAILSLEISVRALGVVKTVFLKAVEFWKGVVQHTASLGSEGGQEEDFEETDEDKEEYEEMILQSGLTWLALGKVQLQAAIAMEYTGQVVDESMMTLPTYAEVDKIINTESELLIVQTIRLSKRLNEDITETKTEMEKVKSLAAET